MKYSKLLPLIIGSLFQIQAIAQQQNQFPDGTLIPNWFSETEETRIETLGNRYTITDYEVTNDSTMVQTNKIQAIIDKAHHSGGGVIVVPEGTYLSGSLFFKPGTHLHLEEGAVLKGSDDISHFPILMTRMEGQTLNYFAALINADKVDGFTISGKGTINGNGLRYWKSFWLRVAFNPNCTNMDEMRPRLIYISNSKNILLSGVRLINSPFWTTHLHKCEYAKLLNLHIFSPETPVKAPSTDAIDLDVCANVLIKNCYISVNDDAVALKGGKGPLADKDSNNGENRNIIIEDCTFGFCHGVLTCGSESIHNYNIILRRIYVLRAYNLLWLKMRPDTPQNYEYIIVENIKGFAHNFLLVRPWTQFFDLKGQAEFPHSSASHITMRDIYLKCQNFLNISSSEQYRLSNFSFENLTIESSEQSNINTDYIEGVRLKNVMVNSEMH